MTKDQPTPEELDRLTDAVLGKVRCGGCKMRFEKFSDLVDHKQVTGH